MELPGTHLSDYITEQELGHGSYGMVYKVKSQITKQTYVIKKINIEHLPSKNQKEVINEAQILKKLDHPHIVKYFCSFLEGKYLCIVMEYINGGDLHKLIKSQQEKKQFLPESEIWRMSSELSSAVSYLHSKNIIHRDIKTLNILVTKDQTVKIADLGASKIVSAPMQVTRVGTPLYLAPELVKHKPYDYKVDVWALGCVIYTLATLHPPFSAENLITLGMHIVNKNPDPLPTIYSVQLSEFIFKLLAKQPIDRPNSASVVNLLPKGKEFFAIENLPTELTVSRNSPVFEDETLKGKFLKGKPGEKCQIEYEPVPWVFKEPIKSETFTQKFLERPSTAHRTRVIIREPGKHRPLSASAKKNPLYGARDLRLVGILPPCVNLDFSMPRTVKKHLTISDLYS